MHDPTTRRLHVALCVHRSHASCRHHVFGAFHPFLLVFFTRLLLDCGLSFVPRGSARKGHGEKPSRGPAGPPWTATLLLSWHRSKWAGPRLCRVYSVLNILPSSTQNPLTPRQSPLTPEAASSQTSGLSREMNASASWAGAQHPTLSCRLLHVHRAMAVQPGRCQPVRVLSFDHETNPNWYMGRGASTP